MFAQVYYPEKVLTKELDTYLEQGWFRMGQTVFTTNFLHFKQHFYSAIWLRVELERFSRDKIQDKLFRQNSRFKFEIKEAELDVKKEELFARYKQGVSFDTSPSLYHLLYGKDFQNLFQTLEVTVFDDENLIAAGFFDTGETAAAGITSFYDPAYKKYSLGKYLIYLKMEYCKNAGLKYFYPGYFVPGYSFFNYKLELGKEGLCFLDVKTAKWFPIKEFSVSPYGIMLQKLEQLQQHLKMVHIETQLFKYEFFDANLFPELKDAGLFDFPLFLNCFSFSEHVINPMIVYDVRDNQYHLIQCRSVWSSNLSVAVEGIYSWHLLKPEHEWLTSSSVNEIAAKLILELKMDWY